MKNMRFSEKQNDVNITTLNDGGTDVMILLNEKEVTEKSDYSEEYDTYYEYNGNIFRTYKSITEYDIRSDLDFYLNYDGDNKPTIEMVEYANSIVDNYTAQLIVGGII